MVLCVVLHNSNHDGRDQNLQLLLKSRNPHHDHVIKIIDQNYYMLISNQHISEDSELERTDLIILNHIINVTHYHR